MEAKSSDVVAISGAQCRMARAAVRLDVRELARRAGVSTNTVTRFERGEELKITTSGLLRRELEKAGVTFVAENGGGAGVRLAKEATPS